MTAGRPEGWLVKTTFQANRARIPHSELIKYRGQWIAVSPDGRRVVAGHADLEKLDALVVAAGEDPEAVALEHVGSDDVYLGAAEHD
jgi:hypothetical protein